MLRVVVVTSCSAGVCEAAGDGELSLDGCDGGAAEGVTSPLDKLVGGGGEAVPGPDSKISLFEVT